MGRKTTRTIDLGELEEGVSEAKTSEGRIHRKALLEAVYDQIKDPFLEEMRIALVDAMKRNDLKKMAEIRSKIIDYSRSHRFILSQIKARKRINRREAEIYIKELEKNGR